MQMDMRTVRLLYQVVKNAHEQWPPDETDCDEVRILADMKTQLYGCIMEHLFHQN